LKSQEKSLSVSNSPVSDLEGHNQKTEGTENLNENNKFKGGIVKKWLTSFLLNTLPFLDNVTFTWEFGGDNVYVIIIQNNVMITKERLSKIENEWSQTYF